MSLAKRYSLMFELKRLQNFFRLIMESACSYPGCPERLLVDDGSDPCAGTCGQWVRRKLGDFGASHREVWCGECYEKWSETSNTEVESELGKAV